MSERTLDGHPPSGGTTQERPTGEQPPPVRCRTIAGKQCTVRMTVLGGFSTPGAHLPTRMVSVDGCPPLLQKWIPRTPSGELGPLDPLDREIRAAHRFALIFPQRTYPRELPRMWFYDVDSDEPFVLYEPYRGTPVADVLQQLRAQDRYLLQVGLLRALHLVGVAGMTHGQISLDTLRWQVGTRTVQLTDFEQAARVGEREADGRTAGIRDDVRDAGLAIWRFSYPTHTGHGAPDLSLDGGALATLLGGVFVDPPTARPTPVELLARLREPADVRVIDLGAPLHEGVWAFEQAVARKRERRAEAAARPTPLRSRWPRLWAMLADDVPPHPEQDARLKIVRCPVCLDSYPWAEDDELWRYDDEQQQYVELFSGVRDPLKDEHLRRYAYLRCPNPSRDSPEHYLPANYHAFGQPLVVAMIGRPAAGKTHLLAAMIREIVEHGGLTPYGLSAEALDVHRHAGYRRTFLQPAERGAQLAGTREHVSDPADILLVRGPRGTRPVTFFDVAGEDLQSVGEGDKVARFLIGTSAVIFVHGLEPAPERTGNHAFEMSLNRLRVVRDLARLPAAVVVTKADRLRYLPSVDPWMRWKRDRLSTMDAASMHAESRDVYAFLHHRGEYAALAPFSVFERCTLHFASASGSEASPELQAFPRGFEPCRVLEPLVAILAMAGMIEGEQARLIGS